MDPSRAAEALADRLAAMLAGQGFKPHQAFPSRREIAARFKASAARVNIAFDALHRRGLLYSIPRKGSFVAPVVRNRQILVVLSEGTDHHAMPGGALDFLAGCLDVVRQEALPVGVTPISWSEVAPHLSDLPHAFPQAAALLLFRDPRWVEAYRQSRAFGEIPVGFYGSDFWLPLMDGIHHRVFREGPILKDLVGHLLDEGHGRILFLGRPGDLMAHRRDLLHRELKARGAKAMEGDLLLDIPWSLEPEGRLAAMEHLLASAPKGFTALCCGDDQTAQLATHALVRKGVAVPEQVAVTGINNDRGSRDAVVPITTVEVPIYQDAREIFRGLASAVKDGKRPGVAHRSVSRTKLVVRASTRPKGGTGVSPRGGKSGSILRSPNPIAVKTGV